MTIAEMRARVREDLQDTDAANYRWTDGEVDGAIERVVREFSLASPIEQQDDIATTDGSKEIDISSLAKLLKVYSVEFPIGEDPPYYQRFTRWQDKLYMQEKGSGDDARVRWHKQHTLDAASSSIPEELEEIIVLGATGYLATSASVYTVDRATIAGRHATANFLKWGQQRLARYETKLKAIARDNRVIQKELYTE
jgi:hypothetical protein